MLRPHDPASDSKKTGCQRSKMGSNFDSLPPEILNIIVTLVVGEFGTTNDDVEGKLEEILTLARVTTKTRDITIEKIALVMTLAPMRFVPTTSIIRLMRIQNFKSAVLRTIKKGPGAQMLTRISGELGISDIASRKSEKAKLVRELSPAAKELLDGLHGKIKDSLKSATVNGKAMYSDDGATLDTLAHKVVESLKSGPYKRLLGQYEHFGSDVYLYITMTAKERVELISNKKSNGPICIWDVSEITGFEHACRRVLAEDTLYTFNSDLYWDTSAAVYMKSCFMENTEFKGDLSAWDVSHVRWMDNMFQGAGISDSGIGNWDVSSVEGASSMFEDAKNISTELDLAGWELESVKTVKGMFKGSSVVNNGIGKWQLPPRAEKEEMLAGTKFNPSAAAPTQFGLKTDDRSLVARAFAVAMRSKAKGPREAREAKGSREAGGARGTGKTTGAGGRASEGSRGSRGTKGRESQHDDSCCII